MMGVENNITMNEKYICEYEHMIDTCSTPSAYTGEKKHVLEYFQNIVFTQNKVNKKFFNNIQYNSEPIIVEITKEESIKVFEKTNEIIEKEKEKEYLSDDFKGAFFRRLSGLLSEFAVQKYYDIDFLSEECLENKNAYDLELPDGFLGGYCFEVKSCSEVNGYSSNSPLVKIHKLYYPHLFCKTIFSNEKFNSISVKSTFGKLKDGDIKVELLGLNFPYTLNYFVKKGPLIKRGKVPYTNLEHFIQLPKDKKELKELLLNDPSSNWEELLYDMRKFKANIKNLNEENNIIENILELEQEMKKAKDKKKFKIYTSYFGNLGKLPKDIIPITICGGVPNGHEGLQYKKLAPKYDFFMKWKETKDNDYYIREFNKQVLNPLLPNDIVKELFELSQGKDVCLICYEVPEGFCHRHLVADWLNNNGYDVNEYPNTKK